MEAMLEAYIAETYDRPDAKVVNYVRTGCTMSVLCAMYGYGDYSEQIEVEIWDVIAFVYEKQKALAAVNTDPR